MMMDQEVLQIHQMLQEVEVLVVQVLVQLLEVEQLIQVAVAVVHQQLVLILDQEEVELLL